MASAELTRPNERVYCRPYTSPLIKVPTYPTITQSHQIVEMTWEERRRALEANKRPSRQ